DAVYSAAAEDFVINVPIWKLNSQTAASVSVHMVINPGLETQTETESQVFLAGNSAADLFGGTGDDYYVTGRNTTHVFTGGGTDFASLHAGTITVVGGGDTTVGFFSATDQAGFASSVTLTGNINNLHLATSVDDQTRTDDSIGRLDATLLQ